VELIMLAVFASLLILILAGIIMQYLFVNYLNKNYPGSLGSKADSSFNSPMNTIILHKFLKSKKYLDYQDKILNRRARNIYIYNNVMLMLMLVFLGVVLFAILKVTAK